MNYGSGPWRAQLNMKELDGEIFVFCPTTIPTQIFVVNYSLLPVNFSINSSVPLSLLESALSIGTRALGLFFMNLTASSSLRTRRTTRSLIALQVALRGVPSSHPISPKTSFF